MTLPNENSPTLAVPRISSSQFAIILASNKSPAATQATDIWNSLANSGVDPSFALGVFLAESIYGKSGIAVTTKSWGNMLYDVLTPNAQGKYSPGNGYTYAQYNSFLDSMKDYTGEVNFYTKTWGLNTIYKTTAKWIGKPLGSPDHLNYVNVVVGAMIDYETPKTGFYEVGDKMVYTSGNFDSLTGKLKTKYPVTKGMELFRGTDGTPLKFYDGMSSTLGAANTYAWYLGEAQGSPTWGQILIKTSAADELGTWVYIKNIDTGKIITVP